VNVALVPYNWLRHVQPALFGAAAALLAWWLVLTLIAVAGGPWPVAWDGAVFLGALAGSSALASVLGHAGLARESWKQRLAHGAITVALSGGLAVGGALLGGLVATAMDSDIDAGDPTLVSLQHRLAAFALAGLATAIGPVVVRKGRQWAVQLTSGLVAGLGAALVWHVASYTFFHDLYLASAGAALTWGGLFGALAWGVPDALYTGWVRVLKGGRFGERVPVDAPGGGVRERFVGHFPRGLDLWLPAEEGVQELHVSVAVDGDQRYAARGLSLHPTVVKRPMERIDVRYDPRRPAPLETRLRSGDRIVVGDGQREVELEFLMLPKEEG